jgi:hypothetical protein
MPPLLVFLIFVTVATTIVALWHYFLWRRLVRDTGLQGRWRAIASPAIIALGSSLPLAMLLSRQVEAAWLRPVLMTAFAWMGAGFLMLVLLLGGDVIRLVVWAAQRVSGAAPTDPARRRTLARLIGGAAAATGLTTASFGAASALGIIPIERLRVSLRRLPARMNGTTLVHLTDMHVGPSLRRAFVEQVVEQVSSLQPDLVAITGDMVDGSPRQLLPYLEPLRRLKPRYGVFFVTGNHEYYSGVEDWMRELPKLGIRVLRNEHVSIGDGDACFDLAGVDDWSAAQHARGHHHDVAAAVRGRDPQRELVLLAHQPRSVWDAARHGVGLQLSGHTHGGQIVPWNFFVLLQQPFVVGLHRAGDTLLYISRGTGFWGPPVRVGSPPEIALIELVRSPHGQQPSGQRIAGA